MPIDVMKSSRSKWALYDPSDSNALEKTQEDYIGKSVSSYIGETSKANWGHGWIKQFGRSRERADELVAECRDLALQESMPLESPDARGFVVLSDYRTHDINAIIRVIHSPDVSFFMDGTTGVVSLDSSVSLPTPPQRLDEMKGVIRDIGDSDVSVSLFQNDEEFCLELPKSVFEAGKVELREDEGFDFWIERSANGSELPVVRPLPVRELSKDDWRKINKRVGELLDGE